MEDDTSSSNYNRKNTSRINKENVTDLSAAKDQDEEKQKEQGTSGPKILVDAETAK